jgi:hypothetical protein
VVLYGCETLSLTLREEHRLRVYTQVHTIQIQTFIVRRSTHVEPVEVYLQKIFILVYKWWWMIRVCFLMLRSREWTRDTHWEERSGRGVEKTIAAPAGNQIPFLHQAISPDRINTIT